jgi:hypothetical protein
MSFVGSINAETRKWLGNNGAAFDGRQVYVGCSGNFSVEVTYILRGPIYGLMPGWIIMSIR